MFGLPRSPIREGERPREPHRFPAIRIRMVPGLFHRPFRVSEFRLSAFTFCITGRSIPHPYGTVKKVLGERVKPLRLSTLGERDRLGRTRRRRTCLAW